MEGDRARRCGCAGLVRRSSPQPPGRKDEEDRCALSSCFRVTLRFQTARHTSCRGQCFFVGGYCPSLRPVGSRHRREVLRLEWPGGAHSLQTEMLPVMARQVAAKPCGCIPAGRRGVRQQWTMRWRTSGSTRPTRRRFNTCLVLVSAPGMPHSASWTLVC